jgi:holo-[acyl-carrier protein] synthase
MNVIWSVRFTCNIQRHDYRHWHRRFLHRIYTEGEIEYCQKCAQPAIHYAARFAAKEAAFKALGTGWAAGVKWKDVEVKRLASGQPELHLHGEALARATAAGTRRFHVSLTHDQLVSCAVVILEADPKV